MATKIEYATDTLNIVTGCTPISEGCASCYAKRMANRLAGRYGYDEHDPFKVTFHPDKLADVKKWRKPRIVFVSSMGDLFHEDVPDAWIDEVVMAMMYDNKHKFLLLTKRPERMVQYVTDKGLIEADWIWYGVTAENQKRWDERVPILMELNAGVRFVSVEPMLGPVTLNGMIPEWTICGAETGPGARRMDQKWAEDLLYECDIEGIPFFFKKMGANRETPQKLLIREMPK